MLPGNFCHAIDAIRTKRADDAMGNVRVVFACREANTNRSVDALSILYGNASRPRRKALPMNFQRTRSPTMPVPRNAIVLMLFDAVFKFVRHSQSSPA